MQQVKSSNHQLPNKNIQQLLISSTIRPQKLVINQVKTNGKSFLTTNHRTLVLTLAVNTQRISFTELLVIKITLTQMLRSRPAIRTKVKVFSVVINKLICSSRTQ